LLLGCASYREWNRFFGTKNWIGLKILTSILEYADVSPDDLATQVDHARSMCEPMFYSALLEGDMGERIEFRSGDRTVAGYRAAPASGGPGVLVLHAWWGMTEMFTGLCDRLAEAGFVALVPDLYDGRTASTIAEAEFLARALDGRQAEAVVGAAAEHLLRDPAVTRPRIGGVGFSLGAGYLMRLATQQPALGAAVVFYGGSEQDAGLARETRASILGHFAEKDEWEPPVAETLRFQEELRGAGMDVTFHVYPGTGHWFFEENRPDAYNADAARLAWERTLEFLRERL